MTDEVMPDHRETIRQKVRVGGVKLYLDIGFYNDARPGEIFLVVEQTGAERRWLYDEVARLASKLIQHGCPLSDIGESWLGTKGRPCGPVVGDAQIKNASSILDYVGRHILVYYCGREDLAHVKRAKVEPLLPHDLPEVLPLPKKEAL